MGFQIVNAERQGIKPLVGLYGKSGGGKTHSALLLARGIVGPDGKIVLICTENRRGHIFSDLIPGGYEVLDFDAPFSPKRFMEAFALIQKFDIAVVDSFTHFWEGNGGVLEIQEAELDRMAGKDYKKREACKMASWIHAKKEYKKMFYGVLRAPIPVICCLRGAEKTHMVKGGDGKNTVVTDDFSTPLFDSRFIFEMLINGEVYANEKGEGGFLRIRKITHPGVRPCLPSEGQQISIEHGKALAAWCSAPSMPESVPTRAAEPEATTDPAVNFKVEIWKLLKPIWEGKEDGLIAATKWLREKAILAEGMSLAEAIEEKKLAADMYTQIPIALENG